MHSAASWAVEGFKRKGKAKDENHESGNRRLYGTEVPNRCRCCFCWALDSPAELLRRDCVHPKPKPRD